MKCEEWQTLIEEYVDGALDPGAAARVTLHLAGCDACASFREALGREQDLYARYQRDVEVSPALWSSIETRIKQERASQPDGLLSRLRQTVAGLVAAPRLSPAFAAALVVVAIGVTVAVMTLWNSRGREQEMIASGNRNTAIQPAESSESNAKPEGKDNNAAQPPAANVTDAPRIASRGGSDETARTISASVQKRPAPAGPNQLVREAEQKYQAAIAMLSRDVNRNRSQLDPMVLARFDASLSEIDRTIKETRRLVRENPGDPVALQYLLAAYSKKVDVLREMTTD